MAGKRLWGGARPHTSGHPSPLLIHATLSARPRQSVNPGPGRSQKKGGNPLPEADLPVARVRGDLRPTAEPFAQAPRRRDRAVVAVAVELDGMAAGRVRVTEALLAEVLAGHRPEFSVKLRVPTTAGTNIALRLLVGSEERASILAEVIEGSDGPESSAHLRVLAVVPSSGAFQGIHPTPIEARPVVRPRSQPRKPRRVSVELGWRTPSNVCVVRTQPELPGIFVASDEAPSVGSLVLLQLAIDRSPPAECLGKVAWIGEVGGMLAVSGYGVELLNPPRPLVDDLLLFSRSRDPIVRDD